VKRRGKNPGIHQTLMRTIFQADHKALAPASQEEDEARTHTQKTFTDTQKTVISRLDVPTRSTMGLLLVYFA
jgi:hypothetical protein